MVLVIDNYDSFTYNLVQYLGELGQEIEVRRNDQITLAETIEKRPDAILLSPGPCTPHESGVCLDLLQNAFNGGELASTPIFGVCLGHQALGLVAGGKVGAAKSILHGKTSAIRHDGQGVFAELPNPLTVTRYHSLAVFREDLPADLIITSESADGEIMGLRHRSLPIEGVQFHPESALTDSGLALMRNWVRTFDSSVGSQSS